MASYTLSYSGKEIDEAVGAVKTLAQSLNGNIKKVADIGDNIEKINANISTLQETTKNLELLTDVITFNSSEAEGWKVTKTGDYIDCFNLFYQYMEPEYPDQTIDGVGKIWKGFHKKTPYPLKNEVITVNPREDNGFTLNAKIEDYCLLKYDLCYLNPGPTEKRPLHGIHIKGERATPPETPSKDEGSDKRRAEAIAVAKSYLDAQNEGRVFAYGKNFISYADCNIVNNESGAAMMECDTFVYLVMTGVAYKDSPYSHQAENETSSSNYTYEFDDLVDNPKGYSWCLPWKYVGDNSAFYNRKITYTGLQNFYFWNEQMVFKDSDCAYVEAGDIVIFTSPNPQSQKSHFFDDIIHIGVIDRDKDTGDLYVYHVGGTDLENKPPVRHELLEDVVKERCSWENVYFARPDYTENKGE